MIKIGISGANNLKPILQHNLPEGYTLVDIDISSYSKLSMIKKWFHWYKMVKKVDVVYILFVNTDSGILVNIAQHLKKKVILHWAGTDVYNYVFLNKKFHGNVVNNVTQLAYAKNLVEELKTVNIDAKYLPIIPEIKTNIAKMPEKHRVLLSIPDGSETFYGYELMKKLISDFKDVEFVVVRGSKPELYPYENVDFKGIVTQETMNQIFDEISIVIRSPKHDGQSLILMEASIKGKYMIYNFDFPYSEKFNDYESLKIALLKIMDMPLEPRMDVHELAIKEYGQALCKERLKEMFEEVLCKN